MVKYLVDAWTRPHRGVIAAAGVRPCTAPVALSVPSGGTRKSSSAIAPYSLLTLLGHAAWSALRPDGGRAFRRGPDPTRDSSSAPEPCGPIEYIVDPTSRRLWRRSGCSWSRTLTQLVASSALRLPSTRRRLRAVPERRADRPSDRPILTQLRLSGCCPRVPDVFNSLRSAMIWRWLTARTRSGECLPLPWTVAVCLPSATRAPPVDASVRVGRGRIGRRPAL